MNITISVPQETEVKLREVSNKSALITRLLNEHFDGEESLQILKIKRDELKDKMATTIKRFNYQIEVKEKTMQSEAQAIKEEEARAERIRVAVIKRTAEMKKIPFIKDKKK